MGVNLWSGLCWAEFALKLRMLQSQLLHSFPELFNDKMGGKQSEEWLIDFWIERACILFQLSNLLFFLDFVHLIAIIHEVIIHMGGQKVSQWAPYDSI